MRVLLAGDRKTEIEGDKLLVDTLIDLGVSRDSLSSLLVDKYGFDLSAKTSIPREPAIPLNVDKADEIEEGLDETDEAQTT